MKLDAQQLALTIFSGADPFDAYEDYTQQPDSVQNVFEPTSFSDDPTFGESKIGTMTSDAFLFVRDNPDTLVGNGGNDLFRDGGGDDLMYGGDGNDVFMQFSGFDTYDGGAGHDLAFLLYTDEINLNTAFPLVIYWDLDAEIGGQKNNFTRADKFIGIESLIMLSANDSEMIGNDEDNILITGAGDDLFYGGRGDDRIKGGDGTDTASYDQSSDNYIVQRLLDASGTLTGYQVEATYGSSTSLNSQSTGIATEGVDTLATDIELLDFNGQVISVEAAVNSSDAILRDVRLEEKFANANAVQGSGRITTTSGFDIVTGSDGNDEIIISAGGDLIDAGAGVDRVRYSSTSTEFDISRNGDEVIVAGAQDYETLANVERIQFTDRSYAIDTEGNAGIAAKTVIACFGGPSINQYLGPALSLVDQGYTFSSLANLVVDAGLLDAATGGTNQGFVNHVFANVVGRDPSALESAIYVNQLESGDISQSGLLALAAQTSLADAQMMELIGSGIGLFYQETLV